MGFSFNKTNQTVFVKEFVLGTKYLGIFKNISKLDISNISSSCITNALPEGEYPNKFVICNDFQ